MLVSPKWQTMWMESQHCSKTTANAPVPSVQAKKLLEDLRASCSSPNKSVQLEALKCWGVWINNQNQEDWKLNTVCYTAVRPLLTKKLQPLHKDVDVCRLRFSLLWALLRKVQNIMQLEGPQYVLEVFLQSCLNWLSSAGDGGEEITELIFQLLLAVFSKEESTNIRDKEMFQSLSADLLKTRKIFNRLADKFLNVFVHWKKVQSKNVILKLWRHFLEHCELSYEVIAVPVWHKIFKLVGQICSEKSEPVKERLGMLHGCANTLRSVLSSSKFLDYGNSLLTPCEALFKKLVELACSEGDEFYDAEMFVQGMEVSKVLSVKSVAIGGYALGISVLNLLDEFSFKCLYWGVWCGLVHCYKSLLSDTNHFTKEQMSFYRKLRGVAVNFELDKDHLGVECIMEVQNHICALNICLCTCRFSKTKKTETEMMPGRGQLVPGRFSAMKKAKQTHPRVININLDLVNHILKTVDVSCVKSFLNNFYDFRFISFRVYVPYRENRPKEFLISLKSSSKKKLIRTNVFDSPCKKAITYPEENDEEMKFVRKTRSQKRAEEEERKKYIENQKRRTRKSFEIRVQEIVQKNKERKTEKNCRILREKRKKIDKENTETPERIPKKKSKEKKSSKLEKYFKVIKKSGKKGGKTKEDGEKKEEVSWKQTSLVTMMMQGKEVSDEGVRTRSREKETKSKMMENSPLSKLSPFKEVFHDHEYARLELDDLRALERVVVKKEESEKKTGKVKKTNQVPEKKVSMEKKGTRKSKRLTAVAPSEPEIERICCEQRVENTSEKSKKRLSSSKIERPEVKQQEVEEIPEKVISPEKMPEVGAAESRSKNGVACVETLESLSKEVEMIYDNREESRSRTESPESEGADECSDLDSTPRKGKKRFRILDSLKPSKKMKMEEAEEKLELEVEKENLEEVKEEKSTKGSPKMNGMISSRALRMIALVPESTRSQVHWETPPKVEVKKKGPNVDKNSRASKMLALLTENVVREAVEPLETKPDEVKSNGDLASTPLVRTPTSSLKSPKTIKQRRSIRFDETRNETVVYETDTPPSQVLERKERWRRISEMNSPIRSIP